jgi:hypothetical protein
MNLTALLIGSALAIAYMLIGGFKKDRRTRHPIDPREIIKAVKETRDKGKQ